tara:strand:+ start:82 stop:279 length:198 start_codon:yes stop_codon:yes gene_type:complete
MKVGDLVRIIKNNWPTSSRYKNRQWRLALVIGDGYAANETKVQMVSDGTVLWFLTTELEAVNASR